MQSTDVAINLVLFKRLRFYHLFDPSSNKLINVNVYRLTVICITIIVECSVIYASLGIFIGTDHIVDDVIRLQSIFFYLMSSLSTLKMFMFLYKADDIWSLFDVTRLNFLTSDLCRKNIGILHKYHALSTKITNFLTILLMGSFFTWIQSPIRSNVISFKSTTTYAGDANRRVENIFNLYFPVSVNVYNDYCFLFFIIEMMAALHHLYFIITFDVFFISFSCVIIAQYKVIVRAFENIGYDQRQNDDDNHCEEFKSILFDQQQLYIKLKLYYSIVRQIIVMSVVLNSCGIIVVTYWFVMMYMSTESVDFSSQIKLSLSFSYLFFDLFFQCYLLEQISVKKESVQFGMYCCDWTTMSLKFKKLLLLSMKMNDANKLMIKVSPKKIIDVQLYTSVMRMSYNIVSVMLKSRST